MLFGRKNPASWGETLRIWLWPRRSWSRSAKYVSKRVLRLTASPHAISAGVAAGVFASFTPFLGLHFLIAFMVAYLIAGNFLSAAMGTFFGNPITFPFIWTFTYKLGTFILSGQTDASDAPALSSMTDSGLMDLGFTGILEMVSNIWHPVLKPMLVGAFPLGVLFGIIAYLVTRWAAVAFRRHRALRRAQKTQSDQL
ncbi:MAG: DUF2062 domain-containing protein [Rhizobiaceae bacterium]|nr:DUF2062 domain-containing protein [Rhizobiaceae bacterium]